MTGKIKFFDWKKGFGFIAGDDGKDYFVGYGGMIKMSKARTNQKVQVNEPVIFDIVPGDEKGPIAINVTRPE